jgi:hypothetical protein
MMTKKRWSTHCEPSIRSQSQPNESTATVLGSNGWVWVTRIRSDITELSSCESIAILLQDGEGWCSKSRADLAGRTAMLVKRRTRRPKGAGLDPHLDHNRRSTWVITRFSMREILRICRGRLALVLGFVKKAEEVRMVSTKPKRVISWIFDVRNDSLYQSLFYFIE